MLLRLHPGPTSLLSRAPYSLIEASPQWHPHLSYLPVKKVAYLSLFPSYSSWPIIFESDRINSYFITGFAKLLFSFFQQKFRKVKEEAISSTRKQCEREKELSLKKAAEKYGEEINSLSAR